MAAPSAGTCECHTALNTLATYIDFVVQTVAVEAVETKLPVGGKAAAVQAWCSQNRVRSLFSLSRRDMSLLLVGLDGAGKTTLLWTLCPLVLPFH